MPTVGDAIDQARTLLHDRNAQLYRYSTADLVSYLNNGILEARRIRPDLFRAFIGLPIPQFTADDLAENFPIDFMFFPQLVFYITGFAELRDDEFAVDNRAVTLMTQFTTKMLTVA